MRVQAYLHAVSMAPELAGLAAVRAFLGGGRAWESCAGGKEAAGRSVGESGALGDAGSLDFQTDEEEEGGPSLSPRSLRCALAHDMTS